MAGSIADDKELERLKDHTLADSYRGRLALWAQEGMLMAADRKLIASLKEETKQMSEDITQKDKLLAKAQEEIKEGERRLALRAQANTQLQETNTKLQDQLDELNAREHTLKEDVKHAEFRETAALNREKAALVRAEKAEKETVVQQRRVAELQLELDGRRPEDEVIRAFKDSDEYAEDLMTAVAADLQRCWAITKDLTMSDPNHSYDAFCDKFEEEPVPLSGTGPENPEAPANAVADQAEEEVPVDAPVQDVQARE